MLRSKQMSNRRAFTLIELLVVIAIVSVLAVAVLLALNPAELVKQTRDSRRIADMMTLTTGVATYQAGGGSSVGTPNVVYTSLPDSSSTCGSWTLPSLTGGWTYSCKPTSTYTNADGTGWIPVNLSQVSLGSPLSQLPVDPINHATGDLFYTYVTNTTSSFEVTAYPESARYRSGGSADATSKDGGQYAAVIEKGSALALTPSARAVTAPAGPSSVIVSGAGTAAANGTYTYRGLAEGKAYYNKVGSPDNSLVSSIYWYTAWIIRSNEGDTYYFGDDGDTTYPYEASSWNTDVGDFPLPTVTQGP